MRLRLLGAVLAGSCALAAPPAARAQVPPVGVPGGLLRVEVTGDFATADRRFFDGDLESYAADFASPALGSDRLPFLADVETRIAAIAGQAFPLSLGVATADAIVDRSAVVFSAAYGLTGRLTLFGRWPLVRVRTQTELGLDPTGATAGINPADPSLGTAEGAAAAGVFFTQFDAALAELQSRLAAGAYDGDPARRTLAEQTLANGAALRGDLFAIVLDPATRSAVLPTATSAAGAAIGSRVSGLQATLAGQLGVGGFEAAPTLPTEPVTNEQYARLVNDPLGPLGGTVGGRTITNRGDAEVGAAYTLIDRWDRDGGRGGLRAVIDATVRLPTGFRDDPGDFLDIGTGDGQTDLELGLTADVGGANLGVRLAGRYVRQFAATIRRRVTSPSQPLVPASRLAEVRWDPGDGAILSAAPFLRLARTFALQGAVTWWTRGDDTYTDAGTSGNPPVPAGLLGEDTGASAVATSIGFVYANPGRLQGENRRLPLDAGLRYERVIAGSGGRVPAWGRVETFLRLYWRPF